VNASSDSVPDPLAALPLLAEAGVSVYWEQLDGRTAWVADPVTREVRLSRSIPPESLLRYFVEALAAIDEPAGPGSRLSLVHTSDDVDEPSSARATLRSV
jgi:hypothetical protein